MPRMNKAQAIELLGGTISAAADAVGITYQAVDKWPDVLPRRIQDRVEAALYRMSQQATAAATGEVRPDVFPACDVAQEQGAGHA